MKMKRISTILLALLMLISFTACNLDNNGILYRGPNRTPSDNKNRNYIGYVTSTTEPTSHSIYFLTSDGLSRSIYNSTSNSFSSDQVLSSDDIFNTIYQSFGWIQDNSIVYLEDTRNNQAFHLVKVGDNGNVTISDLKANITDASGSTDSVLSDPIYLYRYYDGPDPYIVGKTSDDGMAAVYSASLSEESKTLNLTQIFSVTNYTGSENGLLWYETTEENSETNKEETVTKFMYAAPTSSESNETDKTGKEITFWHDVTDEESSTPNSKEVTVNPETIQSVIEHDGTLYVLTSSNNQITIYSGDISATLKEGETIHLNELTTVSAYYNSSFPTYYVPTSGNDSGKGKLIFLDYNISDSSELYCVDLAKLNSDEDKATTQTPLSSGIEAEAFIQFPPDTTALFMMTKNHGFYRIDVSSGTPSVRKI